MSYESCGHLTFGLWFFTAILAGSCHGEEKPFPESSRRFHVVEIVGVKNFAKNNLSILAPHYQRKDCVIDNWSKKAGVESGSVMLPGPMPYSLDATLEYEGKRHVQTFKIPEGQLNKAALYEIVWSLSDNTYSYQYSTYEWTIRGVQYEASFEKDGVIKELVGNHKGQIGRVVHRFNVSGLTIIRKFTAIIPDNGTMYWLRFDSTGKLSEIEIDPTRSDTPVRITLGKNGEVTTALQKPNRKGDYTVEIPVDDSLRAMIPAPDFYRIPAYDWAEILSAGNMKLVDAKPSPPQGGTSTPSP